MVAETKTRLKSHEFETNFDPGGILNRASAGLGCESVKGNENS